MDIGTRSLNNPATESRFHLTEQQLQFILLRIFETAYGNALSHLSNNVSQDDTDHAPTGNAVYTAIKYALQQAIDESTGLAKEYTDAMASQLEAIIPDVTGGLKYEIVKVLPPLPMSNTIYFQLSSDYNIYTAHMFIGGRWVSVGGDESLIASKEPMSDSRFDEIIQYALE